MPRSRAPSPATRRLLQELASPWAWRHGYDLARVTGLKSGTLYPLLIRLNADGLLEAEWRASDEPGRPPRHVYRLTQSGLQFAHALAEESPDAAVSPTPESVR
ncbi:MAG: PadR family transcriptional regulator [Brevundimonas sp.]|uniref:PadR family transcriptional regulator n=1 Tax=Brevundimonas sp. TaxID=1871086 RepID=UPI001A2015CA|nr:PadR family transcriptional regulator [Brevundimonas sp.]MBJ7446445.1 PadR family transcriptional regulator [Brevundimonas sp.]